MKVKIVDYAEFKQSCDILMQMHFLEVLAPRGYSFNMDDAFYEQFGDNLRIIVVYDETSLPIGYCMTIVSELIYDDSKLAAQTIALFMHPDQRKGRAGLKLLQAAQAELADFAPGARWRLGIPIDGARDFGIVLEKSLGMRPLERTYEKLLPGGSVDD